MRTGGDDALLDNDCVGLKLAVETRLVAPNILQVLGTISMLFHGLIVRFEIIPLLGICDGKVMASLEV